MNKVLIIILTLTTQYLHGQEKKISLGYSINFLLSSNEMDVAKNSTFDKIESEDGLGFELGFNFRRIFNDRFELRLNPVIAFEQHKLIYEKQNSIEELLFKPAYLKLPIHGIIKLSKFPVGIVSGFTPSIKIQNGKYDPLDKLELKSSDISIDLGINYSINFKTFTLCPEFRFSKSLTNAAGDNRTEYGQGLATYYRDKFTFGLYFY
jgi:hypothetical protein